MYFVNFSFGILVTCFVATVKCDYVDDPPATNQLYGPDKYCLFVFDWGIEIHQMKLSALNPKLFAKVNLPKHKITFTEAFDGIVFASIADDDASEVKGVAYLLYLSERDFFVETQTIHDGARYAYVTTVNVEATLNKKPVTLNCNTVVSAGKPPMKPCRSLKDQLADIAKKDGFGQAYADKISQIPSDDSC